MQRVEMVATVRFRDIPVSIIKIPLAARRAGAIARCRLRIQAKLRHYPGAEVIVMKVAADTKLRYLDFIGPENFARPAVRVVSGLVEFVAALHVGPDFWCKQ